MHCTACAPRLIYNAVALSTSRIPKSFPAVGEHEITNAETASACADHRWELHRGYWHLVVYTDGSAHNPEHRLTSRAGWAVWYGAHSPYNVSARLCGLVQTSLKSEARALLQVVRTAGFPTIIKFDCLTVVNIFNGILENADYNLDGCAAGDVWRAIAILLAGAAPGFFKCQWIPGHLNDADHPNYAKRKAYLKNGSHGAGHTRQPGGRQTCGPGWCGPC